MTRTHTLTALTVAACLARTLGFTWPQIVNGLIATGVAVGLVLGVTLYYVGRVVRMGEQGCEW